MKKMPLPSPRSPQNLDEAILGYAQQNVPTAKKSYRKPLWVSGLATASVIGLAILITVPNNTGITPLPSTRGISADMEESAHAETAKTLSNNAPIRAKRQIQRALPAKKPRAPGHMAAITPSRAITQGHPEIAADTVLADIRVENVSAPLRELSALLARGEDKKAEAAYQQLKDKCSNCDLPATLAEALENYPATSAPHRR